MDKNNFENEIYSKKIFLLNNLFYIITHQSFNFRNLNDLDNLTQLTELSLDDNQIIDY